ncbi:hypothetical protein BDR04DRAFT_1111405, partial [Suillus decipiens]
MLLVYPLQQLRRLCQPSVLQFLSLVKVTLLSIRRFQNQYSTLVILLKSYSLYRHSFKISYIFPLRSTLPCQARRHSRLAPFSH